MAKVAEYVWDAQLRLYRRKSDNTIVDDETLDAMIDDATIALALLWKKRATDYMTDKITFDEFFVGTRAEIASMNLAMVALAFGGLAIATEDDYRDFLSVFAAQDSYFYRFAVQIAAGLLSEAMIAARLSLYASANFGIYQNAKVTRETRAGMTVYRRLLGRADHCEDCVEYASRGWQLVGSLPRIGDSICKARCKCRFQFSSNVTLLGTGATLPLPENLR